jgi:hypothetical protein
MIKLKQLVVLAMGAFVSLAGFSSAKAGSMPAEMSCSKVQMLSIETGKLEPKMSDLELVVYASRQGVRGLVAELKTAGQTRFEKDVEISVFIGQQMNHVKELTSVVLPKLDFSKVKSVRAANIGVKASRDDGAGILIFELRAEDGTVLGKPLQIGWGGGLCNQ